MRKIGLGLGLARGRGGIGASFSVSIGSGPFTTGTLLTASVSGLVGGETVTYQWQDDGVNIAGATSSTYTAAIGTDSVADASAIRCVITVDGGDPINSGTREIRYAAGSVTESALANWTIDDDVLNVNLASDFTTTNLTGSYVITGLPSGAVDDGDGTISGTADGTPESTTITATFTDQYGRTIVGSYPITTVYRTQATAASGLGPYSFPEDSAITAQNLAADFTTNGNTLTYAITGTALPTALSVSGAGSMTGTPADITASASYTVRATDEYGRTTDSSFTLEITAAAGTITFDVGTYTRAADGTSPTLDNTNVVATSTTAPYYMDLLSVTNGTTPSQADMDAGSGTGVIEKITLGPETNIADLDGALDLSQSITNGRIYVQYRDSTGTPVKSALTSVPTADSITYDAVAPAFSSGEIGNVDDTSLIVTLSKATYGSTTAADWDVQVAGSPATESAVSFTPGGTTVDITLGSAVTSGQAVTVAFNGTGLKGVDNETLATFTAQSVTNNVSGGAVVSDDFSGFADNAALTTGSYTAISPSAGGASMDKVTGDHAQLDVAATGEQHVLHDTLTGSVDHYVEVSARFVANTVLGNRMMLHAGNDGTNGYAARFLGSGDVILYRLAAGSATDIGSGTFTVTLGQDDTFRLERDETNSTVTAFHNASQVVQATSETTHTGGQQVGIGSRLAAGTAVGDHRFNSIEGSPT